MTYNKKSGVALEFNKKWSIEEKKWKLIFLSKS